MSKGNITLDNIASFSSWPARLLGLETFPIKYKSPSEVKREFGDEKWGGLLEMFSRIPNFTLADVEAKEKNLKEIIPCFDRKLGFYLAETNESDITVLKYMKETLSRYSNGASCLVELGAGYGAKIFNLSNTLSLGRLDLIALEYTNSGCDLINLIGKKTSKDIKVSHCDFNTFDFGEVQIPENAIIFTSYAIHYVPKLRNDFVRFLCNFKPKVVVHFEPCYEYFDLTSIHGLMCRRYMELNDYTKNIASSIEAGCKELNINIRIQKNVHGTNPFLPFSVIEWAPF